MKLLSQTGIASSMVKRGIKRFMIGKLIDKSRRYAASCLLSTGPTEQSCNQKLVRIPMIPLLGSTVTQYSGTPPLHLDQSYEYWREMRRRFGKFYTVGMPGVGSGLNGELYVISDPDEMLKVIRNEGPFPEGLLPKMWASRKWLKAIGSPMVHEDDYGLFDSGPRWKKLRSFFQKDMLNPKAAKGFVLGIVRAAELASPGAPANSHALNKYTASCAFDMFNSFMFGEFTQTSDPDAPSTASNLLFRDKTGEAGDLAITMLLSPFEIAMGKVLGIETMRYKKYDSAARVSREAALEKIEKFTQRKQLGKLADAERVSYLNFAIERQLQNNSEVSYEEMAELCFVALSAAVETTSSVLDWNILHLALNPHAQENVHSELTANVEAIGGGLNADMIEKSCSPYLHAVVRESHRLTPAVWGLTKTNAMKDVEIHGQTIPRGAVVRLDTYCIGMDPSLVDDPFQFRPERWLPDAVEARIGTPSEVIDHVLLRKPFGQGSRRCPGSRVANNEVLVMLSQLVLDWKISSPVVKSFKEVQYDVKVTLQPTLPRLDFIPR